MGKGKAKARKQSVREDLASGEEEKIPPVRRRGRPLKPVKDEIEEEEEEEEVRKVEEDEEDSENTKGSVFNKDVKNQAAANGKKRKRTSQVKEADSVKVENGIGAKANSNDLLKSVGFRPNGSRRKNKPRRAAEVGVECR